MKKLLTILLVIGFQLTLLAQNREQQILNEEGILDSFAMLIYNKDFNHKIPDLPFKIYPKVARSFQNILKQDYTYKDVMQYLRFTDPILKLNENTFNFYTYLGQNTNEKDYINSEYYVNYLEFQANSFNHDFKVKKQDSIIKMLIALSEKTENTWVKAYSMCQSYIYKARMASAKQVKDTAIFEAEKAISIALNLNDTALINDAYYYLLIAYANNDNWDDFFKSVKENLPYLNNLEFTDNSHYSVIELWLSAILMTNTNLNTADSILNEFDKYPSLRVDAIPFKFQFISKAPKDHPYLSNLLAKEKRKNLPDLIAKYDSILLESALPNEKRVFYTYAAHALATRGYAVEATNYMHDALDQTQLQYSQQMSADLAAIEADKVRYNKNQQIKEEQAKNERFVIVTASIMLLSIIISIALFNQRRQAKKLEIQRAALEKTDYEKGLLIKEIHHRVKNNFQVVSSLLELQSRGIEDAKAKALAQEGQNRVKSMALIHQRLYQNEDLLISFDEYTRALVSEIAAMYDKEVDADINAENFAFDVDTAVPLGLILNELITNAFKYAIDENHKSLKIYFEKLDDSYKMVVKDNGKGIAHDFDLKLTKSLGLKLVNRLSQQLKGKAEILKEEGAAFAIYFKDTEMRKLIN
ncbi:MAG: sensor histidine kinase [Bacteroidia bacterium]